jgi:ferredoxin-NADP reductase
MKFKLVAKNPVASDVISFVFEPGSPLSPAAGQYFHYVLPHPDADDRGTERWFTNSAAPSEGHVQISTRINHDHGSSFKKALDALEVGEEIEVDGPEGDFTVDDFSRNYVFVAGGIGITPFRSILVEAQKQGSPIKATLLYGNRSSDIPFKQELDDIAAENPNLEISYIVDPERIDATLVKQYVDAVENPLVYISGPEPMVKGLAEDLKTNYGVAEELIKLDDFPGYESI